ncbi:uncharacterized protein [Haliotis cracherodii]|uniref:uncharacterized protein n=1 Tax=Haliotis cracherodii TaxID=6455 RepID=UPI0039E9F49E
MFPSFSPRVLCAGTVAVFCGGLSCLMLEAVLPVSRIHNGAGSGLGVLLLLLSVVLMDVIRLDPSPHHTWGSLWKQYIWLKKGYIRACLTPSYLPILRDAIHQQRTVLKSILKKGSGTAYGRDNAFDSVTCLEGFRCQQGLTSHENYDMYIQRMMHGEPDVMFPGQPDYFTLTSGTSSGKSKLYPRQMAFDLQMFTIYNIHTRRELLKIPNVGKLKFWLDVRTPPSVTKSPSGVRQGPASGAGSFVCHFRPSPDAAYEIRQEHASLYVHALFGLTCKDVTLLSTLTAPTALNFFRLIETQWEAMCGDIERGSISECRGLGEDLRHKLQKHLAADARRAGELRRIFKEGFHNIGPRVWPCLSVLHTASSGAYIPAANILRQKYIIDVPITSSRHVASEGLYGINIDIRDQTKTEYTILPEQVFYEFIHELDVDQVNPQSLLAHEVVPGQSYEMVITNWSGLYRYRTGDIIRVTSFTGQAPNYVLQQRRGDGYDKYPEFMFTEAVLKASRAWTSGAMLNYMAAGNIIVEELTGELSTTAHVYVFIELIGDGALTDGEKDTIDASLQDTQDRYKRFRSSGNYAPAAVIQVKPGTFEEVKKIHMKLNPDLYAQQFKYPKFIKHKDVVACLLSHRVRSPS